MQVDDEEEKKRFSIKQHLCCCAVSVNPKIFHFSKYKILKLSLLTGSSLHKGFTQHGFSFVTSVSCLHFLFFLWPFWPSASDISLVPSLAQSSHYTRTIHPKKINLSTSDACCTSVTSSPGTLTVLQRRLQLASSVRRKRTVVSELKSNLRKDDQSTPQLTGNTKETTIIHTCSIFKCQWVFLYVQKI